MMEQIPILNTGIDDERKVRVYEYFFLENLCQDSYCSRS